MLKPFSRLILFAAMTTSSVAISHEHLNDSIKYKNGEVRANCVYGETGKIQVETQAKDKNGAPMFDEDNYPIYVRSDGKPCGIAWEGSGLYQTLVDPDRWSFMVVGNTKEVWDLQAAYNCCVTDDEPRAQFCKSGKVVSIPWSTCGNYLNDLYNMGEETKVAVMEGCRKAINETGQTSESSTNNWFDVCKKMPAVQRAIPNTFDYLRDNTNCLWNKPYENFCAKSRRGVASQDDKDIMWNNFDWPEK